MRRTVLVAVVIGAGVVVVSGWLLSRQVASTADDQRVAPPPVTAPVQRQVLEEVVRLEGTIEPSGKRFAVANRTVYDPAVVTRLPESPEAGLSSGDVLVEISGRPVMLFSGSVPAYRSLSEATAGADVEQLERALAAIGLFAGEPDATFDDVTFSAVSALYAREGYTPPPASELPLAEYAFAPGKGWAVAEEPVELGQTPGDPLAVVAEGDPALVVSADPLVAAEIEPGAFARLSTASGTHDAEVADVSPVEQDGEDGSSLQVVLAARSSLPSTDLGQPARASVIVRSTGTEVLVVPAAALRDDGSGRDVVEVVGGDDVPRSVQVDVGLVTGGAAAVSPADAAGSSLKPGDEVLLGE